MKCLVSGATGFIGRELCRQLLARGDTVIGLSRRGADLADGVTTVAVDLAAQTPDVELLRSVDVVVHLGGIAHQNATVEDYQSVNVDGTLRLARLAHEAQVGCFIFVSSVRAMGSPVADEVRSEGDCTVPVDPYSLSKWQAECALREEFDGTDMSLVVLRPPLVYGQHAKGNLHLLAAGVRRGLPRPPADGCRSMVALHDLVALIREIADNPPSGVHTWIACGDASYSTRAIYDLLRQGMGKGPGRAWLPRWVWRLGTALLDIASGKRGDPTYEKMFGTELYSNAAVVTARDWRPQGRLEDVIVRLVEDREVAHQ